MLCRVTYRTLYHCSLRKTFVYLNRFFLNEILHNSELCVLNEYFEAFENTKSTLQSLMAVPLELKSFTLLFKPRNIINNSLTSFLSVRTVSYGLVFFVQIYGPSANGKKTRSATYGTALELG